MIERNAKQADLPFFPTPSYRHAQRGEDGPEGYGRRVFEARMGNPSVEASTRIASTSTILG